MLAVRQGAGATPTRVRLWFGETELRYLATTGEVDRAWVHVSLGGQPVARIENNTTVELSYHGALQQLRCSLDTDGEVVAEYIYGAFGEVLSSAGQVAEHTRRWNGKEQDEVSGLLYYGARYYDPVLLGWTQADPVYRFAPDLAYDQPRRLNLYSFSLQNPLRYVDPDGRGVLGDAWDWTTTKLIKADNEYSISQRAEAVGDVSTGVLIAAGGCAASAGTGCVAAAAAGAKYAGQGIHELVTGAPQPSAVEAVAGPQAEQVFDAVVFSATLASAAAAVTQPLLTKLISSGAGGTAVAPEVAKGPPNPYGKMGGPAHQAKVQDVAADVRSRGLEPGFEHRVKTPGGTKQTRFVDVVGKDAQGNVVEMHQVGRQTKGGKPVSREVKALDDIENATGSRPVFHPYQ